MSKFNSSTEIQTAWSARADPLRTFVTPVIGRRTSADAVARRPWTACLNISFAANRIP